MNNENTIKCRLYSTESYIRKLNARNQRHQDCYFKCKIFFMASCRIHRIYHKQLGKKRYENILIRFRESWGNLFATNFHANSQRGTLTLK